ncbi:nucleotidyl transferase AbiEii/AbiGii toxin family protein [Sphingobacterium sp. DR205]|uniref:nucleotidyl transferase AbiEii/AbiGii toxin family protein n=1 Tax=Sphingobacterium sp. DR205 TaxID=2713573 RepID=UPI0013E4A123|nr:nucleotidyl transferase AbiEii/AbiGii toxin family protein [Sphingobacterium sp. DR205]QIH36103.1 nucleotidyl transferase AbiEii/AbiGii toxin family protein [Sphingobacterium sp. DR205]
MILKKEIEKKALEHEVSRSTIDKDWALGHFVDAIFSIDSCREALIFKGGTCLRKCYIPDYRFSEDLDFTSINSDFQLDEDLLRQVMSIVQERTGMQLHLEKLTDLRHNDMPTGYAAVVKFWGADHSKDQIPPDPSRWTTSIKIEIILYEKMLFASTLKTVYHDYSDQLSSAVDEIACYDIREVLSEKLRALIQRSYTAPRDYYDIWYLSKYACDLDWAEIKHAFLEKMAFKGLEFTGIDQLLNAKSENTVKRAWKNSLGHQIATRKLPAFDEVKKDLELLFNTIFKRI